jgi:hypothetical protein
LLINAGVSETDARQQLGLPWNYHPLPLQPMYLCNALTLFSVLPTDQVGTWRDETGSGP